MLARRACIAAVVVASAAAACAPPAEPEARKAESRAAQVVPCRAELDLRRPALAVGAGRSRIDRPGRIQLGAGWSDPEPWGTWAVGRHASLRVALAEAGPLELRLVALPHLDPREPRAQRIEVAIDGTRVGEVVMAPGVGDYRLALPDAVPGIGVRRIDFTFAYARAPEGGGDVRELAAGFAHVGIAAPGADERPAGDELECEAAGPARRASPRNPARPARLPDIVVVVLDAARPDHFGCYGYGRATTPNIDRLARRGVLFRNAFATASYTLASVPTMLTGLSFVHHGVELNGQVLAPELSTLAEQLDRLGYRTVCYSANPNHSAEAGLDQGCDEFERFWGPGGRDRWIDPALVTDRALARLAQGTGGEPLFLMLHYVPPHEPYRPGPEFDVFGDPAYRGAYDGELGVRQAIDRGELHPTRADMDEIVALYDGNLLKADHAFGRLLEGLEQRERWAETVLVVTADHGEAFMEHGRMGHNTTVHEEMLRVPLIVRLPGDRRPPDADTLSAASLEDLAPTLLALAGTLPDDTRVEGVDLFGAHARRAGRAILARSAGEWPDYALSTGRWKAIRGGRGATDWRLYDLVADPGERHDLSLERFDELACLAALAERTLLAAGPAPAPPARDPAADLEALRALGYVN